eukprot:Opistho-1_new@79025
MLSFTLYGTPQAPTAIADEKGNAVVMAACAGVKHLENVLRATTVAMGCISGIATAPMSGAEFKARAVRHSLSHAWRIGRAVNCARAEKTNPVDAIVAAVPGARVIFAGKVTDVVRTTEAGFACGTLTIEPFADDASRRGSILKLDFRNENLVARLSGAVVACVPDLISVVDAERGDAFATEQLIYGLRVAVVVMPAPALFAKGTQGHATVSPAAFGLANVEYVPCGDYMEPQSVFA